MKTDNTTTFDSCLIGVPASKTTTFTSSPVNLQAYSSSEIEFIIGASSQDTLSGSIYWTCTITECATFNGSFTAVAAADIIDWTKTPANSIVINSNALCGFTYRLGYKGNLKYIKGVITATGSHSYGNVLAMVAHPGDKRMGPTTQKSIAVATA
jgi:hypothetical protein